MIRSIARSVLAAVLSVAFLGGSFQLAQSASGSLCTLTCCAGRAPHAAGSCMNGSCRAPLKISRHPHAHIYNQTSDQFCGVERVATRKGSWLRLTASRDISSARDAQGQSKQTTNPATTVAGVTKPCDPTCGGMSISSTQTRPRESTAAAFADKPRPPTQSQILEARFACRKILNGFWRQRGPRGPPAASS